MYVRYDWFKKIQKYIQTEIYSKDMRFTAVLVSVSFISLY